MNRPPRPFQKNHFTPKKGQWPVYSARDCKQIFFPSFLDMILSTIFYYGAISCLLYIVLAITEMIILKVLYIFKFSTIAAVNEYFMKNILISFNVVMIGVNLIIRLTLKEHETSPHRFLSNLRPQNVSNQFILRTDAQDNAVK